MRSTGKCTEILARACLLCSLGARLLTEQAGWAAHDHHLLTTCTTCRRVSLVLVPLLLILQVIRELEDGTSKPLQVKVGLTKPGNRKDKVTADLEGEYVLKRCGGAGGTTRNAHIVSEFTAMAMYARAGLRVPQAALYTVRVRASAYSQGCMVAATACCVAACRALPSLPCPASLSTPGTARHACPQTS